MEFSPRDALDAVRDVVANAVDKASDMVEFAGDIVRGDVAGGTQGIVQSSMDIATYAAGTAREVFTGQYAGDRE